MWIHPDTKEEWQNYKEYSKYLDNLKRWEETRPKIDWGKYNRSSERKTDNPTISRLSKKTP